MSTKSDPRDVILAPVVSEKSYGLIDNNAYTFMVHPGANKTEIRQAIEQSKLSVQFQPVVCLRTGELQWAFANTDPGWAWHRTGHFVAFDSSATNLVAGDSNGADDIFLYTPGSPPDHEWFNTRTTFAASKVTRTVNGPGPGPVMRSRPSWGECSASTSTGARRATSSNGSTVVFIDT